MQQHYKSLNIFIGCCRATKTCNRITHESGEAKDRKGRWKWTSESAFMEWGFVKDNWWKW